MKRITIKDGPRAGSVVDVPDAFTAFAHADGIYRIKGKTATWEAGAGIKGTEVAHVVVDEAAELTDATIESVALVEGDSLATGSIELDEKTKPKRARK